MSEAQEQVQVDPSVEREARSLGWSPKDRWRGPEDSWVDAETFLKRGKEVMPLLKATNARLEGDLAATRAEVAELKGLLKSSAEAIDTLKKYHTEDTKRAVENEVKRLKAAIVQARKDENVEAEVDLQDQLDDAKASLRETVITPPAKKDEPPAKAEPNPDLAAWVADGNEWFGTDKRKTALAIAIGQELNASKPHLKGRAFLDEVAAEVAETLGETKRAPSKVDASGGGRGSGGGARGGKSYADLPTDAKEACAKFADGLVGDGKAYKDLASWQAAYAADYFAGE